jgi:hypothetical protein
MKKLSTLLLVGLIFNKKHEEKSDESQTITLLSPWRIVLGYAQAHVNILGQRGLYYHDLSSLQSVVAQLINEGVPDRAWNAYENFSASSIIPKFIKVFIEPAQDWWVEVKSRGIDDVWDPGLYTTCGLTLTW